ncbi:putative transporter small subunit [Brevibacterium luteolum]|nr:putative transporter small subunit [Brevibacterium luteolum]MCT1874096.1 putative transporter small subunit [Brevibacterium luteolum]MCT1889931.1 putative transporter small subunit [Brevibacterium luteolum]MCT1892333.1 putative transporter small subunit [Brevibacterium luteolum]MCT1923590.1 putative transporter small subunit [Brevibacterium luteolum]
MSISILTLYMLMWPVIVAGVLFFIVKGFIADVRSARKHDDMVI